MLVLASTLDLIRITTTTATTTLTVHATWVNLNGTTVTPGRLNTPISGAVTNTTIVSAPASASDYKTVKGLDVANTHATLSQVVEINHYDGTTSCVLWKGTLLAGESAEFDGEEWYTYDSNGRPQESGRTGLFLKTTLIQNPTTTFTTGPNTNTIVVRLIGAGGGGGGASFSSPNMGFGGGGGGGGYAEKTFQVSPNTSYTCAVGTGGTAGANTGGTGGNGSAATTFAVGATTVTANVGQGGVGLAAGTGLICVAGGAGGTVSTNGDVNFGGNPGQQGVRLSGILGGSGGGGSAPLGGGAGVGKTANGAGAAATTFGGGGGGAAAVSASQIGGAGGNGCIIVDEYQ